MTHVQAMKNPAGFWVRLLAQLIDGVILSIPAGIIYLLFKDSTLWNAIASLISLTYSVVLPVIWDGQTLGKKALHIRIKKVSGEKVGFGTMVMRAIVGNLVYGITLGIAFIVSIFMVAFRNDKRSVHDFIAGTYVGRDS